MEGNLCNKHKKKVAIICLAKNCDNSLICQQCLNFHNGNHNKDLYLIESEEFEQKKLIYNKTIKDIANGKKQIEAEEQDFEQKLAKLYDDKIEGVLNDLRNFLNGLKQKTIEKISVQKTELKNKVLGNHQAFKDFISAAIRRIESFTIAPSVMENIQSLLPIDFLTTIHPTGPQFGIASHDFTKKQIKYKCLNYSQFMKIKSEFVKFYNNQKGILPVLEKYISSNMAVNLDDAQLAYKSQEYWIYLKQLNGQNVQHNILIEYDFMKFGDSLSVFSSIEEGNILKYSDRKQSGNDSVLFYNTEFFNL